MEAPETSSQNPPGVSAARRRSTRAILSGFTASVADLGFELVAADADRAAAMAELLHGLPAHPGPAVAGVAFDGDRPPAPEREPDVAYSDLAIWREGGRTVLRHDTGVSAVITPGHAHIGGDGDLELGFRRCFQFIVTDMLAAHGLVVLHAGAILVTTGAVLAFGRTGAGKSTLVAAALDDGRRVLSDDLVVVRRGGAGALEVTGVPRPPAVPGDVAMGGSPGSDKRRRVIHETDVLEPGWHPVVGSVRVGHGTTGALERLRSQDAATAAMFAFLSADDPKKLRPAFAVAAAIGRLPAWDLCHAADATTRLAVAAALLRQVDAAVTEA